jgi:hypothetical protein
MTKGFLKTFFSLLLVFCGFLFVVNYILSVPVMELNVQGNCLRVIDGNGKPIKDGCKKATKGEIATEHRYVAM